MSPSTSPSTAPPQSQSQSQSQSNQKEKSISSSSSSSNGCWWILAAIPLVIVGIVCVLEATTTTVSNNGASGYGFGSGSAATDEIPGLDFGTGSMFDSIATRYDTINRVLALRMDIGWRRKMTTRIKELLTERDEHEHDDNDNEHDEGTLSSPSPASSSWRILDVATGTADVALQLVDDLGGSNNGRGSGVTVLGLDPSANMLAVGRSKIHRQGLDSRIRLEQADARDLSRYYAKNTAETTNTAAETTNTEETLHHHHHHHHHQKFDAATVAFGIRNVVPNRAGALCEIHRLLVPGGVLAILEFSQPTYESHGVMGAAAGWFISRVVPVVGGLLSGGAHRREYRHLQNSIREFPGPDEFNERLESLECPLLEDDPDHYFYVGHYAMEDVTHMNFGSVQLYIGRASIRAKAHLVAGGGGGGSGFGGGSDSSSDSSAGDDPKLPPIGSLS